MDHRVANTAVRYVTERGTRLYWRWPCALIGLAIATACIALPDATVWDHVRAVQVGLAAYLVGFSFKIIRVHGRLVKRMPGPAKSLPLHIQWIAVSYVIFVIGLTTQVVKLIGEPPEWNVLPFALVGSIVGVLALGFIWRFQLAKAGMPPPADKLPTDGA